MNHPSPHFLTQLAIRHPGSMAKGALDGLAKLEAAGHLDGLAEQLAHIANLAHHHSAEAVEGLLEWLAGYLKTETGRTWVEKRDNRLAVALGPIFIAVEQGTSQRKALQLLQNLVIPEGDIGILNALPLLHEAVKAPATPGALALWETLPSLISSDITAFRLNHVARQAYNETPDPVQRDRFDAIVTRLERDTLIYRLARAALLPRLQYTQSDASDRISDRTQVPLPAETIALALEIKALGAEVGQRTLQSFHRENACLSRDGIGPALPATFDQVWSKTSPPNQSLYFSSSPNIASHRAEQSYV